MKTKIQKIFEHAIKLSLLSDRDEKIYGDSFIEFRERSIKILDPSETIIKNLDKEVLQTSKVAKGKPYGKSILKNGNQTN